MVDLLMPKATAIWLVDNTGLTFKQIADFCDLHELEVKGIADEEIAKGIKPCDPITSGQLTREEIGLCEKDPNRKLHLAEEIKNYLKQEKKKKQAATYVPVARRQDKPNAIAWLLKNCPEMSVANIAKLVGSTKKTIESIRDRTHWNIQNIKPQDPVLLGLCLQGTLDNMHQAAKSKLEQEKRNSSHAKAANKTAGSIPHGVDMSILDGFTDLSSETGETEDEDIRKANAKEDSEG